MADDTTTADLTVDANALTPPLSTDEAQIHDTMVDSLQTVFPDWEEVDGALDNQLMWAAADVEAETRASVQATLQSEVMSLIGSLFHLPRQAAVSAGGSVTVTAVDGVGYTLDAGTTMWLGDLELQTLDDLVLAAAITSGSVDVYAVDPGADPNGSTGDVTMDPLIWVETVALDAALSGGVDEETDIDYGNRLVAELQTLAPRPILPADFAVLATQTDGIEIAWAIDGYDPTDDSTDNERTVTVVCAAADGTAPDDDTLTAAQDSLDAQRELNFQVFCVAPTYVTVNVAATIIPRDGWADADAQSQAEDAINGALDPGAYAAQKLNVAPIPPPSTLYANDLVAQVMAQSQGVLHVTAMTVNSGASVSFDTGELPQAGTVAVSVAS